MNTEGSAPGRAPLRTQTNRSESETRSASTISTRLRMKPDPTPWNVRPTSMSLCQSGQLAHSADRADTADALHRLRRAAHRTPDKEHRQTSQQYGPSPKHMREAAGPGDERRRADAALSRHQLSLNSGSDGERTCTHCRSRCSLSSGATRRLRAAGGRVSSTPSRWSGVCSICRSRANPPRVRSWTRPSSVQRVRTHL